MIKGSPKIATLVFGVLATLATVVIIGSFIGAVSWINKPFAGFLLYYFPQDGSMSLNDWQAPKAGIKLLERI